MKSALLRLRSYLVCFLSICILPCSAQVDWPHLKLVEIPGDFVAPVHVVDPADNSGRLFVVEQPGTIKVVQSNAVLPQPFLDISDRSNFPVDFEDGLMSLAFPTNFSSKGWFYIYYLRTNDAAAVISRFRVSTTNANVADLSSEQQVMVIPEQYRALNGGLIAFGPDGFLYVGTGDNAYDYTEPNLSQDLSSLWGKMLRIDVETVITNSYLIPPGNPFVGNPSRRPEIWASGLRNLWRYSWDRLTGDLYIGDIGQNAAEEINFQPANAPGGQNYGWPLFEGSIPFFVTPDDVTNSLTFPVIQFQHDSLTYSAMTAGFAYRGPAAPRMNGIYFYGDFGLGTISGAVHNGNQWQTQLLADTPYFISSFGEDANGRLYLLDYIGGKLFRLEDNGDAFAPSFDPPGTNTFNGVITLSSLSPGVTIRYTTNGLDPVITDPGIPSGATVFVSSGATLKARSFRTDLQPSEVTTSVYFYQVHEPTFTPAKGPITNGTTISIADARPGASIRYTLDGTTPTTNSTLYTAPFTINASTTVSARAFLDGYNDSPVHRVFYGLEVKIKSVLRQPAGNFQFVWDSLVGHSYQVQFSEDLVSWWDFGFPQSGTGNPLIFTYNPAGSNAPPAMYFRIRILN